MLLIIIFQIYGIWWFTKDPNILHCVGLEFIDKHADWIKRNKTAVGSCTYTQLDGSSNANDTHIVHCHSVRNEIRLAMNALLKVNMLNFFFFGP